MNTQMFKSLVEKFGDEVVFELDGEFCFGISDDEYLFGNEGKELMRKLENEVNEVDGVCWYKEVFRKLEEVNEVDGVSRYVWREEELVSGVGVKELSDFDKVKGLQDFVLKFVGKNYYLIDELIE